MPSAVLGGTEVDNADSGRLRSRIQFSCADGNAADAVSAPVSGAHGPQARVPPGSSPRLRSASTSIPSATVAVAYSFPQAAWCFATMRLSTIVDCRTLQVWNAPQHNVQDLPSEVLLFLLASRYCEVDSELKEIAWQLFSQHAPRLAASAGDLQFRDISISASITQQARANRTAWEVYYERVGVCRDYMHLAITFCRCMNIPARYCTGYLGDIGVPGSPIRWISALGSRRFWAASGTPSTPATTCRVSVGY